MKESLIFLLIIVLVYCYLHHMCHPLGRGPQYDIGDGVSMAAHKKIHNKSVKFAPSIAQRVYDIGTGHIISNSTIPINKSAFV